MRFERLEHLRKEGEHTPDFRSRFTYVSEQLPPVRAYFHRAGFGEAYTNGVDSVETVAKDHLIKTLSGNPHLFNRVDFMIAALWGRDGYKMIDLARWVGLEPGKWPGNPELLDIIVFKNEVYMPQIPERTCEDSIIVFGKEAEYRRTTKDLTDFMEHPPDIEGLVDY